MDGFVLPKYVASGFNFQKIGNCTIHNLIYSIELILSTPEFKEVNKDAKIQAGSISTNFISQLKTFVLEDFLEEISLDPKDMADPVCIQMLTCVEAISEQIAFENPDFIIDSEKGYRLPIKEVLAPYLAALAETRFECPAHYYELD